KALEGVHNSYLSFGFAAGYIQRSVDLSQATYSSQYVNGSYNFMNNSGENWDNNSIQNYDLGVGVSFNSSLGEHNQANYYVGASAYHLTKPRHAFNKDEAYLRLEPKWSG